MGIKFVVDAAIIDKGRVLLVKNKKNYDILNGWILPGGKVAHQESFEEAIEREMMEECGIGIKPEKIISVFVSPLSLSGRVEETFVVVGFLARPKSTEILPSAEEISEARWFPLSGLPSDAFPDSIRQLRDGGFVP